MIRVFKIIRNIIIGWTVLLFALLVVAAILYDPIGGLVEIPMTLLIYAGIPYGVFWIVRKRVLKRRVEN